MSAAPKLHLSLDAADGIARTLADQERTIMRLTEENDDLENAKLLSELRMSNALHEMDERVKLRLSLLERRVVELERRLAEVGAVADRVAQFTTVLNERVDGIAARETL